MYHHVGLTSKKLLSINDDYHAYIILYAKNDIVIDESINNIEDISTNMLPKILSDTVYITENQMNELTSINEVEGEPEQIFRTSGVQG